MTRDEFKHTVFPLHEMLYRIAYRFVESKELAEDIIQDCYVKLWEKREDLIKLKSVKAFAITMVKNASLDKIKTRKYSVDEQVLINQPSSTGSFDNNEQVLMVKKVIQSLPEQQKRVIELRDIDGLEYHEISETLQMELVTIRANLSIARKKVRAAVSKIYSYGLE